MANSATVTTTFQFRLRSVAATITVLAVLFAALAPWLRQYDAGQWWRFAQIWLCGAAGFAPNFAIYSLLRHRAVRRSGPMLGSVQVIGLSRMGRVMAASVAVLNIGVLLSLSVVVANQQSGDVPHVIAGLVGFGAGVMSGIFLSCTGQLQLCEHGLVREFSAVPWKSVQSWRWEGTGPSRVLVMRIHFSTARFEAASGDEPAIEALLTSRVGRPDRVSG